MTDTKRRPSTAKRNLARQRDTDPARLRALTAALHARNARFSRWLERASR